MTDAAEAAWWDTDELQFIAAALDSSSLAALCCTCHAVHIHLSDRSALRWLAELRGLPTAAISSVVSTAGLKLRSCRSLVVLVPVCSGSPFSSLGGQEHLELAEIMAHLSVSIFFGWGSMEVDEGSHASLQRLAKLLARHPSLELSIEAHCGLEARWAMPLPGQAREFTRARAQSVLTELTKQADAAGVLLDETRVRTRAWGCSRRACAISLP